MTAADVIDVDPRTGELLPVPLPRPELLTVAPAADVVALQRAYVELCEALLTADDYQRIGNGSFKKKSAWRKLAAAFNVSDTLVSKTYDRDPETGQTIRAEYLVRATAPNGRTAEGLGIASVWDKTTFTNPEHDIPATAHTRAKNRAFSDLFGLGEVSAEEMHDRDDGDHGDSRQQAQRTRRSRSEAQQQRQQRNRDAKAQRELEPGERELEARILANEYVRTGFRKWRATKKYPWPPTTGEMFLEMEREVGRLEAEADRDDSYADNPAPARNQPSAAEWDAYQGGASLGT